MASFLQTQGWADFASSVGDEPVWIDWQGERILALKRKLRYFGGCLSVSRTSVPITDALIKKLIEIAAAHGCIFIRFEPECTDMSVVQVLRSAGASRVSDFMPSRTIVIDLKTAADALRTAQHPKTRYNIGLAERKGVICERARPEEVTEFIRIIGATYDRKGKRMLPSQYYERILGIPGAELWVARYEGKVLVANICIGSGDTYTYLHGGSDDTYKQLMAPHLLQWQQQLHAQQQGYSRYDLWGIDEERYPGVTRFKRGFGGREIAYIGTWEIPVRSLRYRLYRYAKGVRK